MEHQRRCTISPKDEDANSPVANTQSAFDRISSHPWFSDIDWKKLEMKEVTPPFIPQVCTIISNQE